MIILLNKKIGFVSSKNINWFKKFMEKNECECEQQDQEKIYYELLENYKFSRKFILLESLEKFDLSEILKIYKKESEIKEQKRIFNFKGKKYNYSFLIDKKIESLQLHFDLSNEQINYNSINRSINCLYVFNEYTSIVLLKFRSNLIDSSNDSELAHTIQHATFSKQQEAMTQSSFSRLATTNNNWSFALSNSCLSILIC